MGLSKNNLKIYQGDVWLFDPDPIKENEIGKKIRPGVIISHNSMNASSCGLVFMVLITSVCKGIPSHVLIDPPEGGLLVRSYAICEQIRSISKIRLSKKLGEITSPTILEEIRAWLLDFTSLTDL